MRDKVLIVEDQFIEANDLRLMLEKAGYQVTGIARSVPKATELIEQDKPSLVLLDIYLKGKLTGIDLAKRLREENIAFVYLSANSSQDVLAEAKATQPYGFLVKPFREKDVLVALEIARYRHEHSLESGFRREAALQKQLAGLTTRSGNWQHTIMKIGMAIQPYVSFDLMRGEFKEADRTRYTSGFLRIGFNEYQRIGVAEFRMMTGLTAQMYKVLQRSDHTDPIAAYYVGGAFTELCSRDPLKKLVTEYFGMASYLSLPLHLSGGGIFYLSFYSRSADTYTDEHLALFNRLQRSLAETIDGALAIEKIPEGAETLKEDPLPPDENSSSISGFEGIVGTSHRLLNVFDSITQVAPLDTSVLILGESGTGKERVADCLHRLSPRKMKPFIKVNCAALPASLIESELFGHEKGAFTGATDRRIGKFEQASGGTILLDEIGEMPIELQVKWLRVLQEKEIERIGGSAPIKVDVRVIAATNKDLEKEVAEGRFRLDLYYRLNVFPIQLPPLRERKEDIPALANHFVSYFARKTGKKITGISTRVLQELLVYRWPGNVRELEHLIERSVLLTKGDTIRDIVLPDQKELNPAGHAPRVKTILENERDHILEVLKKCEGKIWGAGGAAELLNVPPTTLQSKMKKLGIKKEHTL
ncbi:sigma 54-interacting transcriptional regulator [Parachryseolinea silvisoli]|uniref:sigma 54-interacting transcriptional regulator n=1 Tax=Parachryseolinea silvisoli TaxID=2873601 RepID=UPI002265D2E7|nr:sigma 54-interacting transcriptional regulator [Parachryseolinea silvisoli]MCD9014858.1 sigma 54-interacting transcriptional regulator [Parachryseolinea silvisoli]